MSIKLVDTGKGGFVNPANIEFIGTFKSKPYVGMGSGAHHEIDSIKSFIARVNEHMTLNDSLRCIWESLERSRND